jgi:arylsulfatase A-like enzyme
LIIPFFMKPTLIALLALAAVFSLRAADAKRPNIILMMADDMGFSCISPYGGEIHTPNLQRLADEGLRFTQFYNNAKCTTTRASLLSGMYPRNSGNSIPQGIATVGEPAHGHLRRHGGPYGSEHWPPAEDAG